MIRQHPISKRPSSFEFGATRPSPKAHYETLVPQSPQYRPGDLPKPTLKISNASFSYKGVNQIRSQ